MSNPSTRFKEYIYPRVDKRTGEIYFEWTNVKLHLAGILNPKQNLDKFLFSTAKNVLGSRAAGVEFKRQFMIVTEAMAKQNMVSQLFGSNFLPIMTAFVKKTPHPPRNDRDLSSNS